MLGWSQEWMDRWQEWEVEANRVSGKGKVKLSLYAEDMILYIENLKESSKQKKEK